MNCTISITLFIIWHLHMYFYTNVVYNFRHLRTEKETYNMLDIIKKKTCWASENQSQGYVWIHLSTWWFVVVFFIVFFIIILPLETIIQRPFEKKPFIKYLWPWQWQWTIWWGQYLFNNVWLNTWICFCVEMFLHICIDIGEKSPASSVKYVAIFVIKIMEK